MKIKLPPHLTIEVIQQIIDTSIQYLGFIIIHIVVLFAILVGLKLLFNFNIHKAINKRIEFNWVTT